MMCSICYKINEACWESLQVLRGEKGKPSKKTQKPVVTSETVKGSSGRDRWAVRDA